MLGVRWGILDSGERRYLVVYDVVLSFFIAVKIGGIKCVVMYHILSISPYKGIKVPVKLHCSVGV